ncbi:MAG: ACP S-malonyltransferase [Candidatus Latescibacteria bacterium]|nr:ACP S-malonyltransferase [Candidatus Latescibacterota bacterium]
MGGRAFLFPGQGSQAVGMGADLCAQFPEARELFAQADELLGFSLSQCCFEGPEEELRQTAITQPALFVHSAAACRLLEARGIYPSWVAGHSLGEYSALAAAGVLDFATGLELVRRRGQLMQEQRQGSMAAVLGLEDGQVVELCSQVPGVVAANFNAPGQVVISGEVEAVARAGKLAEEAGAKRVVELPVSGAFHSPLMEPAARELAGLLQAVEFRTPRVPVLTDVAAAPVSAPGQLQEHLIRQMTSPVRWTAIMQCLAGLGVESALEVGPGSVLRGLARRAAPHLKVAGAGTAEEIAAPVAAPGDG